MPTLLYCRKRPCTHRLLRSTPALLLTLAGAWSCSREPTASGGGGVRERWYQAQPGYGRAQPAVTDGVVFFGTGEGQVIARDAAVGAPRWTAKVDGEPIDGANIVARGGVVVVSVVRRTVGLDAATGRELWRYEAPTDTGLGSIRGPGQVVASHLDADDQTVYVPAWGASVSALDLHTGAVRWVWQPGRAPTDTAVAGRFRSGSTGVQVSGDTVFATAWHNLVENGVRSEAWLLALDRTTGRELWRIVLPPVGQGAAITGAPAVAGSLVIAITRSGETYAVDRSTRRTVWQLEASGRTQVTPAQAEVYGDAVYVDGGDRHIYSLRASDGTVLWRAEIASQATRNLLVTERRVLVPEGARLHVLDRGTGRVVTTTTQPYVAESDALFASPAVSANGRTFIAVNGAAWSFEEP